MRFNIVSVLLLLISFVEAQTVSIPNANFKTKLLAASTSNTIARNLGGSYFKIDANNDGEIQLSEAQQVSYLDVSNSNILNLTGIEAFVQLIELNCTSNYVTTLNTATLINLRTLRCGGNELTTLDVSTNTQLINLLCEGNHIVSLDIQMLANLETLNASGNELTNLTLGNLDNLIYLTCQDNNLTSINAPGLNSLRNVELDFNDLTSLNLSGSSAIEDLRFHSNNLTSVDLTSLTNLHVLDISVNPLTSIDLTNQVFLETIWCHYTDLTTLNVNSCMFLDFLDLRFCDNLESLYIRNDSTETVQFAVNNSLTFVCCDAAELTQVQNMVPSSCTVSSTCDLSTTENLISEGGFFPNPIRDLIYFEPQLNITKLEIYDMSGRLLITTSLIDNQADLNNLSSGTYLAKATSIAKNGIVKIVKE
jgi:hypothetical protein